jgi:hypothetical protein
MKKKYFIVGYLFCVALSATAQNVSSPYSILGIGDIENNDYGRYSASGSASAARREVNFYNFANPASLTAMYYKAINFDVGFRGRVSQFKLIGTDTLTKASKDFIVKRITLAFKLTPTIGIAAGLKPYSSVNYQYTKLASITDGSGNYAKYTDGSGGIYQSYFSVGKAINKHLSIGATASWLFGSLQNSTQYYNPLINLDITKEENKFYNAAGLQGGLQYYSLPGKTWQHTIGITTSIFTTLKGQNTTEYIEGSDTIKRIAPENISFKLPLSFTTAYTIANKSGISFSLQGSYQKWPTQKADYKNSFVKDAYSLAAGMEYSKKIGEGINTIEKYYVGWGIKMEQNYLMINNKHLTDYSFTVGGGKNLSRYISVNAGIEVGHRGKAAFSQIQENYLQFNTGITLKDFWFGTKKFGRYN